MQPTPDPLAYFLTFTTYGTWLHGRDAGSVDAAHNEPGTEYLAPDSRRVAAAQSRMRDPEYRLDAPRRVVVLRTVIEVAAHRRWLLWAIHVRTNHVHVIATGPVAPEKMLVDFKAYATRRLREAFGQTEDRTHWTEHGSTRYLWTEEEFAERVHYVLELQGEPMERYDGRGLSEPEA